MTRTRDIVVSTTSTLEGFTVSAYHGVVSAHVVAGTGLFSDAFASFSDVFGGRSQSYQKQLASINDEVISLLKGKAKAAGANCILGLKIDHDEVSGGGKSMFMVTATGTAARVETVTSQRPTHRTGSDTSASLDEINTLVRRHQLVEAAENGELTLNDDNWEFLYRNQVAEVAPTVLAGVAEALSNPQEHPDDFVERASAYFHNLENDDAVAALYEVLSDENAKPKLRQFARKTVGELGALDMDVAEELLRSDDLFSRKMGLALLLADQQTYTPEDANKIEGLRELVSKIFPTRGREIEVEKRFSSKTEKRWECECGTTLSMEVEHCISCGNDIRGFMKNELRPDHIENLLTWRLRALKTRFPQLVES